MTNYDIDLGQGDGDLVAAVLKENGVGSDLSGATVVFAMKSDTGTEFDIPCNDGAIVNGSYVAKSAGGVTIPFTSVHASNADIFYGKFLVTISSTQYTFPSGNDYISVRVWEAV